MAIAVRDAQLLGMRLTHNMHDMAQLGGISLPVGEGGGSEELAMLPPGLRGRFRRGGGGGGR
jgi:hypothetical protein